jgi:hypothetical protein
VFSDSAAADAPDEVDVPHEVDEVGEADEAISVLDALAEAGGPDLR